MLDVQSHRQQPGFCGPASLKMLLGFYGLEYSEDKLGELAGCTPERGVTGFDIVAAAEKIGLAGFVRDFSDLKDIDSFLNRETPVIVEWFSEDDSHFSVVVKIDEIFVYLQDPELAGLRKIEIETFLRIWFSFDSQGKVMRKKEDLILRRMIVIEKKQTTIEDPKC